MTSFLIDKLEMPIEEEEDQYFNEILNSILPTPRAVKNKPPRKTVTLPKNDIRNNYAKALEDLMNCSDPAYVYQAFHQLLDPECKFDAYFLQDKGNGETVETLDSSVVGIDEITGKFVGCIVTIPDSIFLIHEWKIFVRPNNSCCLVCKFSFTGTKVFDFSTPCIFREYPRCKPSSGSCSGDDAMQGVEDTSVLSDQTPSTQSEQSGDNGESCGHSIVFKETSKTIKYDNRKRGKQFTVGEYIRHNEMYDCGLPNLQEEVMMVDAEENSPHAIHHHHSQSNLDGDDVNSMVTESTIHNVQNYMINGAAHEKGVMSESHAMNAFGLMRFHINGDNKIVKIHCVRLLSADQQPSYYDHNDDL
eukprot:gene10212-11108_t